MKALKQQGQLENATQINKKKIGEKKRTKCKSKRESNFLWKWKQMNVIEQSICSNERFGIKNIGKRGGIMK